MLSLWDEVPEKAPLPPAAYNPAAAIEKPSDNVPTKEEIDEALSLLGLPELPSTDAAINEAFKQTMRAARTSHDFGSPAANDLATSLLAARAILKRALAAA